MRKWNTFPTFFAILLALTFTACKNDDNSTVTNPLPSVDVVEYTIVFNKNADDAKGTMANLKDKKDSTVTLTANSFTREGYKFTGWNTKADGTGMGLPDKYEFKLTQDLTLYAQWQKEVTPKTISAVTITGSQNIAWNGTTKLTANATTTGNPTLVYEWALESGSGIANLSSSNTNEVTLTANNTATTSAIARVKVTAKDSSDATITKTSEAFEITVAAKPVTKHTVTFNLQGGTGTADAQQIEDGQTAVKPIAPEKTGHKFEGWFTGTVGAGGTITLSDTAFDFYTPVTANLTLYAKWTPKTYKIHFNNNFGEGVMEDQTFTYGVKQPLSKNTFTRENHTFNGWNPVAVVTTYNPGTPYSDEQVVSFEKDITLYAQWIERTANKYTVTFNSKGGSAVNVAVVENGQKATKPADPTKDGYTFAGWFTSTDGGTTLSSEQFDFNTTITADTVLYAAWTEITAPVTFTLSFVTADKDISLALDGKTLTATPPSSTAEYTYAWYVDLAKQTSATTKTLSVANLAARAKPYAILVTATDKATGIVYTAHYELRAE